jgi:hypothetical protein
MQSCFYCIKRSTGPLPGSGPVRPLGGVPRALRSSPGVRRGGLRPYVRKTSFCAAGKARKQGGLRGVFWVCKEERRRGPEKIGQAPGRATDGHPLPHRSPTGFWVNALNREAGRINDFGHGFKVQDQHRNGARIAWTSSPYVALLRNQFHICSVYHQRYRR